MLNLRNMILAALMGGALLVAGASVSHATQPECTGDRHYDGVACCPDQPEECPTCEECKPEKSCPSPTRRPALVAGGVGLHALRVAGRAECCLAARSDAAGATACTTVLSTNRPVIGR